MQLIYLLYLKELHKQHLDLFFTLQYQQVFSSFHAEGE